MTAVEPVAPAPQPDRALVAPVRDQIDQARQSLGAVAQWLHGFWPAHLTAPVFRPAELRLHLHLGTDLLAARTALAELGRPERIGAPSPDLVHVEVELPGVVVHVQAARDLWSQVFPADDLPEAE